MCLHIGHHASHNIANQVQVQIWIMSCAVNTHDDEYLPFTWFYVVLYLRAMAKWDPSLPQVLLFRSEISRSTGVICG